jgi:hypothetical protein
MEVSTALHRLQLGRMAGPDHITSELLKGAHVKDRTLEGHDWHDYLLAGELATLSQHLFSMGLLPPVWCDARLCAVFKKGHPSVYGNYRGIAVGTLVGKLYSMEKLRLAWTGFVKIMATGRAGHWSSWLPQKAGLL